MKRVVFFLVLVQTLWVFPGKTQTLKRFSGDSARFVEELSNFMSPRINENDRPVLDEFMGYYRSGVFSEEQKSRIRNLLNQLLQRKARPKPHFLNYLKFISVSQRNPIPPDDYDAWEEGFLSLLKNNKYSITRINRFLKVSILTFSEHILYHSGSVTWKTGDVGIKVQFRKRITFLVPETYLICLAQRDSIMIFKTSGVFDPTNIRWEGNKGRVTWEKAGYKPDKVYAQLDHYRIDMTKASYVADSVLLTFTNYFDQPIPGSFSDKVRRTSSSSQAIFPVFTSFTNRFHIKDIYPDIDYDGGFVLKGAAIQGIGNENQNAGLQFFRHDTLRLSVTSLSFMIKGNRISSRKTTIKFMLGTDSIYHPGIAFFFNIPNREVSLYRTEDPLTKSPFFDSYHMIDMSFEQLVWKMDKPVVKFTMARGSSLGQARFKSVNFFNQLHFMQMQGMDLLHPLIALRKFANWYYSDEFPVSELAKWLNKPDYQIQILLVHLAQEGFVFYDAETEIATIKPQLDDYLAASAGKIDYDVIDFVSNTRAPRENGRLNLNNNEITLFGIPQIHLSDSQNVAIYPGKNQIVMSHDRNFKFSGVIKAGLLTFYGDNFSFNYDSFKIDLQNIDSLSLRVQSDEEDEYGQKKIKSIENSIQNITGELFIDKPANKSGLKDYPEYPFFMSSDQSYVYYEITEGMDSTLYARDKFYYQVNPFKIKDLTKLKIEDLDFSGEFHGGNIFPALSQNLVVQEDMSLGFTTYTPPEGLPAYGGKARYFNEIMLTNRGIEGKGKLEYMNATVLADTFKFFPDSMLTEARQFTVQKDTINNIFPYMEGNDVAIKWYPSKDEWHARKSQPPFSIFNEKTTFSGDILMTPDAITGDGLLTLENAEILSKRIVYHQLSFKSDTANLKLKSDEPGKYALEAKKVSAIVNLADKEGFFSSLVDTIPLYLPEKNYLSAADFMVWDLKNGKMGLVNTNARNDALKLGKNLPGRFRKNPPTFISMNPRSDSLNFKSDSAMYTFEDQTLTAYKVDFLEIADAKIFPAGNSLSLEKNGHMKGFRDARIIANDVHVIDAKQINILGRNNYYGSGTYSYTDQNNSIRKILFSDIKVDKSGHTHAEGALTEADSFLLSPYFSYIGKVTLNAEKKFLDFAGGTRLNHHCDGLSKPLIAFHSEINPDSVTIPITGRPVTPKGRKIYKGIFITNDSTHIYSTFFANRLNYSDTPIADAEGFLVFDEKSGEYRVAAKPKLTDPSSPGNLLSLNRNYCIVRGEGKLNPGVKLGQLKLEMVGNITHNRENNKVNLDVLLGIKFFFSPDALSIMANEINAIPTLKPVNMKRETYKRGLVELLGKSKAQSLEDASLLFGGSGELPEKLKYTLLFTQLNLVWNEETASYISKGMIGIGNINGFPVNRLVNGFIEIQKKRTGDMMDIFLQIDEKTWYYFGYTTGVMQSLTSNRDFLDVLTELKNNQRREKVQSGKTSYIYMSASDRKIGNFRRRMQTILDSEETPELSGEEINK